MDISTYEPPRRNVQHVEEIQDEAKPAKMYI